MAARLGAILARRTDAYPNNARIQQLAKELRDLEEMPLADFLKSYIPKPRVTAMPAVAEQQLMWSCECGNREWNHYQWCAKCGKERPAPPPEPEPSDITHSEASS